MISRRAWLAATAAPLLGCDAASGWLDRPEVPGGFVGADPDAGHRLRDAGARGAASAPGRTRDVAVLIAGGGIAGLAAARALRAAGVDDFALLELQAETGGNSRAGQLGGIACPLGAHYLPLPSDDAPEVQHLLEELGLRRRVAGRWVYDERHLCHSPQERLYFRGRWHDGLLPLHEVGDATLAQYRLFARRIDQLRRAARFRIPVAAGPLAASVAELDSLTFSAWLDREGLVNEHLRWYLDYCCRDDYGAGTGSVSAWAGVHYFASRHGFAAPGDEGGADEARDGLLTWPEGNGWLARQLAAPLGERQHTGQLVTRIAPGRHGVTVDTLAAADGAPARWHARQVIVALPLFVAARVIDAPPAALPAAAAALRYAPWLVANVHIAAPLDDRPGAAPAWDNVIYGSAGLGYVDAMHQRLDPTPGATVLTCYRALGDEPQARQRLLDTRWQVWRDQLFAELAQPHPDLPAKARRIELVRYGHAMALPLPGLRGNAALQALRQPGGRLHFAHGDLSGYSIFEEAFTHGQRAGRMAARALRVPGRG